MSQQFPLTSHISIRPFGSQNPISKLRTKQSFCPEVKFNRHTLGQGSCPGFTAWAYPEGTECEASRGGKCNQTPTAAHQGWPVNAAGDCSCWPLVPGMGEELADPSEELGACSSHFWNTGLPAAFKKRKQISGLLL